MAIVVTVIIISTARSSQFKKYSSLDYQNTAKQADFSPF